MSMMQSVRSSSYTLIEGICPSRILQNTQSVMLAPSWPLSRPSRLDRGGLESGQEGASMTDCVFCKIRDGQIPSMRVYEDERTLCIMDINPVNAGHCLVVTRAHAATLFDTDPADLSAAIVAAQKVARAIRQVLKPDGLNMLQASGAAAFQSVPHF